MKLLLSLLTIGVAAIFMSFTNVNSKTEVNELECCTIEDGPVIVYHCTDDGSDPCKEAKKTILTIFPG